MTVDNPDGKFRHFGSVVKCGRRFTKSRTTIAVTMLG